MILNIAEGDEEQELPSTSLRDLLRALIPPRPVRSHAFRARFGRTWANPAGPRCWVPRLDLQGGP
jgi:hypothetical protein